MEREREVSKVGRGGTVVLPMEESDFEGSKVQLSQVRGDRSIRWGGGWMRLARIPRKREVGVALRKLRGWMGDVFKIASGRVPLHLWIKTRQAIQLTD